MKQKGTFELNQITANRKFQSWLSPVVSRCIVDFIGIKYMRGLLQIALVNNIYNIIERCCPILLKVIDSHYCTITLLH